MDGGEYWGSKKDMKVGQRTKQSGKYILISDHHISAVVISMFRFNIEKGGEGSNGIRNGIVINAIDTVRFEWNLNSCSKCILF